MDRLSYELAIGFSRNLLDRSKSWLPNFDIKSNVLNSLGITTENQEELRNGLKLGTKINLNELAKKWKSTSTTNITDLYYFLSAPDQRLAILYFLPELFKVAQPNSKCKEMLINIISSGCTIKQVRDTCMGREYSSGGLGKIPAPQILGISILTLIAAKAKLKANPDKECQAFIEDCLDVLCYGLIQGDLERLATPHTFLENFLFTYGKTLDSRSTEKAALTEFIQSIRDSQSIHRRSQRATQLVTTVNVAEMLGRALASSIADLDSRQSCQTSIKDASWINLFANIFKPTSYDGEATDKAWDHPLNALAESIKKKQKEKANLVIVNQNRSSALLPLSKLMAKLVDRLKFKTIVINDSSTKTMLEDLYDLTKPLSKDDIDFPTFLNSINSDFLGSPSTNQSFETFLSNQFNLGDQDLSTIIKRRTLIDSWKKGHLTETDRRELINFINNLNELRRNNPQSKIMLYPEEEEFIVKEEPKLEITDPQDSSLNHYLSSSDYKLIFNFEHLPADFPSLDLLTQSLLKAASDINYCSSTYNQWNNKNPNVFIQTDLTGFSRLCEDFSKHLPKNDPQKFIFKEIPDRYDGIWFNFMNSHDDNGGDEIKSPSTSPKKVLV